MMKMIQRVPIDDFDIVEWENKYAWNHAIGYVDVITYSMTADGRGIQQTKNESYIKMIPVNPLLKFFGLLSNSEMVHSTEICFESEDAERFYNKHCRKREDMKYTTSVKISEQITGD